MPFVLTACFQMPSMEKTPDAEVVTQTDATVPGGINSPLPNQVIPSSTITPLSVPSIPTNLAYGSVTANSVLLSWSPSSESSGAPIDYRVYRIKNGSSTLIAQNITATNYRAELPAGSISYFVRSHNSLGVSENSNTVTVVPLSPNPTAPGNLVATLNGNVATLNWDASVSPLGNGITYRVLKGSAQSNVLQMQGIMGQSYTTATLTPAGSTHSFFVQAVDSAGNVSSNSNIASVTLAVAAPNAPTGLTTSNLTYNSVSLSWSGVSSATGYHVFKKIAGVSTQISNNQAGLSYAVTGLTPGVAVSFYVQALNSTGPSANSAEVSVTPTVPVPSVPGNVAATLSGTNAAVITWNAATSPMGSAITYRVYSGSASNNALLAQGLTVRTYTAQGLSPGTQSFFIQAVDNTNSNYVSANSAVATVSVPVPPTSPSPTPTVPVPVVPTGLAVSALSYQTLTLSWSAASGATSYIVSRTQGSTTTQIASGVTATSLAVTGLTPSTAYSFKVKATNTSGNSADSIAVSTTTLTPTPTTPSGVAAVLAGSNGATITWNASTSPIASAISYQIYQIVGSNNVLLATQATRSYLASGLSFGATSSFFVKAIDATGVSSANSATASVSVPAITVPTAPTGLTASNVSYQTVNLSWTAATGVAAGGAITYRVFKTVGSTSTQIGNGITTTSYQATGLTSATLTQFYVQAVNSAGASTNSNTVSVTTLTPIPSTITNVAVTLSGTTSGVITWGASTSPVGNAITYKVFSGNATTNTLLAQNLTALSFTATQLPQGATSTFFVKAADSAGNESLISNIASLAVPAPAASAPTAPLNLAVSNVTSTSATISWSASTATGSGGTITYQVYRLVGSSYTSVATGISALNYGVTGLTAGSSTVFHVRALNSIGLSPQSSDVTVITTVPSGASVGTAKVSNFKTVYYRMTKMLGLWGSNYLHTTTPIWHFGSIGTLFPDIGYASEFTEQMMFPYTKLAMSVCTDMTSYYTSVAAITDLVSGLQLNTSNVAVSSTNTEAKWTDYINKLGTRIWGRLPTAAEMAIIKTYRDSVATATAPTSANNARAVGVGVCALMMLAPSGIIE